MTTKIEWTDESWNPVVGCSKASEGCQNCYAEKMACRLACINPMGKYREVVTWKPNKHGQWNGEIYCDESVLNKPLHWRKPRRIFVCSMGDLFHEKVPFEFIGEVYGMIAGCSEHIFQILTKRPDIALKFYKWLEETQWPKMWPPAGHQGEPMDANVVCQFVKGEHKDSDCPICKRPLCRFVGDYEAPEWPLKNLHLGVTVESQKHEQRIVDLLQIPAAKRFVCFEPLLEEINLAWIITTDKVASVVHGLGYANNIHQVIIGCESGPKRRLCKLEWVESLIDQCDAAGVKVFVKQIPINGRVSHNPAEWPEKLRRRELI